MSKHINKIKEVEVAAVEGNKTLAAGVDHRAAARCKNVIKQHGLLHTPIIGVTKNGARLLLCGQRELGALRELGIAKMEAMEVEVSGDSGERAKLSLLLSTLQEKPGALCEGQLLHEALKAGVPRTEIQTILEKSASWVSNRLSLVRRLDANVYDMVRSGMVEARSAQEIARLPSQIQFIFTETALREGLPKSAIESLVALYNDEGCPEEVKAQILTDPRAALMRTRGRRRAVVAGSAKSAAPNGMDARIQSAKSHLAALERLIWGIKPDEAAEQVNAFKEIEKGLLSLLAIIERIISPGKTEVSLHAG